MFLTCFLVLLEISFPFLSQDERERTSFPNQTTNYALQDLFIIFPLLGEKNAVGLIILVKHLKKKKMRNEKKEKGYLVDNMSKWRSFRRNSFYIFEFVIPFPRLFQYYSYRVIAEMTQIHIISKLNEKMILLWLV